jgi:hypothetical protein
MRASAIETLKAWKEVMYENAKARWPDLTPEEFRWTARRAIKQFPANGIGLQEAANRIEAELIRFFGEGIAAPQHARIV